MSYISLKSGTDIRGVASPLGGKEVNLTGGLRYYRRICFMVHK